MILLFAEVFLSITFIIFSSQRTMLMFPFPCFFLFTASIKNCILHCPSSPSLILLQVIVKNTRIVINSAHVQLLRFLTTFTIKQLLFISFLRLYFFIPQCNVFSKTTFSSLLQAVCNSFFLFLFLVKNEIYYYSTRRFWNSAISGIGWLRTLDSILRVNFLEWKEGSNKGVV